LIRTIRTEGKLYAAFLDPVLSKSHGEVGVISVFDDVTDDQRLLRQSAVFNGVIAVLLWVVTVAFSLLSFKRARPSTIACSQIPLLEEGQTLEFKSSLRWDYKNQRTSKDVERAILKSVVGFLNSENGGTLVVGMSDTRQVLGLEADYASFKRIKPDRDGFEQVLHQIVIGAIGENRCARCIRPRFCSLHGKELCVIAVAPSNEPVFLEEEDQLFVRVGNSTRPFGVQEALEYARHRWGSVVLPRPHPRRPVTI
jgi:hypothetical protein